MAAVQEPEHLRVTYNDVHNLIRASAQKIAEFKPDMLIAIGARSLFTSALALTAAQAEGQYAHRCAQIYRQLTVTSGFFPARVLVRPLGHCTLPNSWIAHIAHVPQGPQEQAQHSHPGHRPLPLRVPSRHNARADR